MNTRPIVPLLAALVTLLTAEARAQNVSGDLAAIQGRWWTRIPSPTGGPANVRYMDIYGDKATALDARGNVGSVSRVVLDESKTPKTIDFLDAVLNHPQRGQVKQPDTFGVYELDGDRFRFAVTAGGDLTRRPAAVVPDALKNVVVMSFRRGQPPAETAAARVVTFERAIVFPFLGQDAHFRTAQGEVLFTGSVVPRATDAEGRPVPRPIDVLVPGNIVDVTVQLADRPRGKHQIQEVRLVHGKVEHVALDAPGPGAGPAAASAKDAGRGMDEQPGRDMGPRGASYKGAVITKVGPFRVTLNVRGKTVVIGRTNFETDAVDLKGNQLPPGQKQRLLKVGNTVDVEVRPKNNTNDPDETPPIRSIRLIKGELASAQGRP